MQATGATTSLAIAEALQGGKPAGAECYGAIPERNGGEVVAGRERRPRRAHFPIDGKSRMPT